MARELASQGRAQDAQATRKLKRPVVAASIVNQVVHQHPEHIEELLAATRTLEKAHRHALSGRAPEQLKAASRAFQQALDAVMADVNALLSATGRPASGDLIRQVDETLRAASLGAEEDRSVLSQGMLTQPLRHSGFGPFSSLLLVGPSPGTRPRPGPAEKPSSRHPTKPPARAEPPSTGGKVLQGPWAPRSKGKETPPKQARTEPGAQARRAREAELEQRKREARQRAELSQQAAQAERDERSARREVALKKAALKTAEAKTLRARSALETSEAKVLRAREVLESAEAQALHARQAFERAEAGEQQQAEAVSQATARARVAAESLAQARRDLHEAGPRRTP